MGSFMLPERPTFLTATLNYSALSWGMILLFTFANGIAFMRSRKDRPSLMPHNDKIFLLSVVLTMFSQLLCILTPWLLHSYWEFCVYFALCSATVQLAAISITLAILHMIRKNRMQQRILYPQTEMRPLKILNYSPSVLKIFDQEGKANQSAISHLGKIAVYRAALAIFIGQILTPLLVVSYAPPDCLNPLVVFIVFNFTLIILLSALIAIFVFLLIWMKGMTDALGIVSKCKSALYATFGFLTIGSALILSSLTSSSVGSYNWIANMQGFIAAIALTTNLFIIYGFPLLHRSKADKPQPATMVSEDCIQILTAKAKDERGRLIYSRSLRPVNVDFDMIMSRPLFFQDFKRYACDRYAGEGFQFLELLNKWQVVPAPESKVMPVLRSTPLEGSLNGLAIETQFSATQILHLKRRLEVFIRPEEQKALNLTSATTAEALRYLDSNAFDARLEGLMSAKKETIGLIQDNFFQAYCNERNKKTDSVSNFFLI